MCYKWYSCSSVYFNLLIFTTTVMDMFHPLDNITYPNGTDTGVPSLWMDHYVEETRERFDTFFCNLSAIGGSVDYFYLDVESGFQTWQLQLMAQVCCIYLELNKLRKEFVCYFAVQHF